MRGLSQLALALGFACLVAGWWFGGALPPHAALAASVLTEPDQTQTRLAPFSTEVGGIQYQIKPVFDYAIEGLVVSEHDSGGFFDIIHADWNDNLNVVDLCVVWGANASDGAYEKMEFSSGQFVCYFNTHDRQAAQPQYFRALSNNHLLTDDPVIARRLRNVRIGDQISLRGQLVEYSHDHGFAFHRGTSTTRDDTGDGACETIFVRQFSVLRKGPVWPRVLGWLGCALLVVGVIAWFRQPLSLNN
ncbi:hypothetical protein BH10PSE17_BH10PSE17_28350 [soil metagenome]